MTEYKPNEELLKKLDSFFPAVNANDSKFKITESNSETITELFEKELFDFETALSQFMNETEGLVVKDFLKEHIEYLSTGIQNLEFIALDCLDEKDVSKKSKSNLDKYKLIRKSLFNKLDKKYKK